MADPSESLFIPADRFIQATSGMITLSRKAIDSMTKQLQSSSALFHNSVHALSMVDFHADTEAESASYTSASDKNKRHIRVLDGLAQMLTYAGKSEVVATAFIKGQTEWTLVWAKNDAQPPNEREQEYFTKLIDAFHTEQRNSAICEMTITMCKDKFVTRCIKLANVLLVPKTLGDVEDYLGLLRGGPLYFEAEQILRKRNFLPKDIHLSDFVDGYLRLCANARSMEENVLAQIARFLWALWTVDLDKFGLDPVALRRLTKVAEYFDIIHLLSGEFKKVPRGTTVTQRMVANIKPRGVAVEKSALDALNEWSKSNPDLSRITSYTDIKEYYPFAANDARSGSIVVQHSYHCELTILDHMVEHVSRNPLSERVIDIGCSKQSCFWCHAYIKAFNELKPQNITVRVRGTQSKRTAGWLMPVLGDVGPDHWKTKIRNQIFEVLAVNIHTIFEKSRQRRGSDSRERMQGGDSPEELPRHEIPNDEPMFIPPGVRRLDSGHR